MNNRRRRGSAGLCAESGSKRVGVQTTLLKQRNISTSGAEYRGRVGNPARRFGIINRSKIMIIKESDVLERIGMCIDDFDLDELAALHNRISKFEPINDDDIAQEEGWHLIPKKGAV